MEYRKILNKNKSIAFAVCVSEFNKIITKSIYVLI